MRPDGGEVGVVEPVHSFPGDLDGSGGRPIEGPHHVQERGLPRSGRTHDGDRLTAADFDVDASERSDWRSPGILLGDSAQTEDRIVPQSHHHVPAGSDDSTSTHPSAQPGSPPRGRVEVESATSTA
jgi:hypothetical protein